MVTLICKQCQKEFQVKKSHVDKRSNCSRECGALARTLSKNILTCPTCKITFRSYENGHRNKTYCSTKCYSQDKSLKSLVEQICANCKSVELVQKWKKKKYCSKKCYGESNRGENNYNWRGKDADENVRQRRIFMVTIRDSVIERDNYTCQMCNKRGGKLHVDHIQPWADYVELRFDIDNCRTLCIQCHFLITYKRPPYAIKKWGSLEIREDE